MTDDNTDSFTDADDAKSSVGVLAALKKAEDAFRDWQAECSVIDQTYNRDGYGFAGRYVGDDGYSWQDSTLDLFWASFEVLKPAVYARPPQPVVAPLFKDSRNLQNTTAELLERCAVSTFKRTGIDDVMIQCRDDLLFAGRGVMWLRYENDGGKKVCVEHKDRLDFLHEPARYWSEVGWVAAASWLTKTEMKKRFAQHSDKAWEDASYTIYHDDEDRDTLSQRAGTAKCKVWEVWHKADGKVYWVTEGVEVFLDVDAPHLKLSDFFPCPRPAYATLKRRSLIPVPDWDRYTVHFNKISDLTGRIYLLLDSVRMKGLIPAGGDVGDAVEQLMASNDDQILIPVPGAALLAGGASNFVQWLPLAELAQAITGLIDARTQLINDFYQLSGISDIMRGATEADETLGAQQLKSQYGSVRVREKSTELQRLAADAVKIATEIMAEKFDNETMLEMSQMDIPTKADLAKRVKEIEKAAEAELKALEKQAKEQAQQAMQSGQQVDPNQAQSMMQQAQQGILQKYAPMLAEVENKVPVEDVMKLLRDEKTLAFQFEIESSSTVLIDEMQEKASRNEFMAQFMQSSQAMQSLVVMGEEGATLAGEMLKFVLAPYRAGRTLDSAIDAWVEAAPQIAARMQAEGGDSDALAEANKTLAEAEMTKAKAAMAGVEAKGALDKAEMQRKLMDMQAKASADQQKAAEAMEKLRQSAQDSDAKLEKTLAEVDHLRAQTAEILTSIGLDARKQDLAEYQAAESARQSQENMALQADKQATDTAFREQGEQRADRQQDFGERQAMSEGDA